MLQAQHKPGRVDHSVARARTLILELVPAVTRLVSVKLGLMRWVPGVD
jgi:hypothetical protein